MFLFIKIFLCNYGTRPIIPDYTYNYVFFGRSWGYGYHHSRLVYEISYYIPESHITYTFLHVDYRYSLYLLEHYKFEYVYAQDSLGVEACMIFHINDKTDIHTENNNINIQMTLAK